MSGYAYIQVPSRRNGKTVNMPKVYIINNYAIINVKRLTLCVILCIVSMLK